MTSLPRRALLAAPLLLPALAKAQGWPERPIRWIVNFPPGGAADTLSRALGESIGGRLGQPIVIENRPGAGGLVGADLVAKARGDAHVVIMSNAASHGIGPVLYPSVPYDPLADFTHIALVGTFASVLVVNPGVPARTLPDFVALARGRPGGFAYGTGGNGTMNHLVGQLLARAAGIELTHVPYRGSAPALADCIGGQIPAVMESLPIALPHLKAGRLRALGTSEAGRDAALPETPSFAEAGYPTARSTNWFGFSAAAGIPDGIAARWGGVIAAALADPRLQERFAAIGVVPGRMGAAEYTALIAAELDRWRGVIRDAGVKPD
ncbi:Bug family tripartite tricarboxylate transporter substrate binding protein [Paracraurococcus lichenis]|uniref:Tripartite tricarboxylate transporter substrate binding protein n=1 Tax=Paracraurococcus lichenis TaxID=3064888 RepID=A0ABT9DT48_9PROT|nr:tripartite tricarboxylate transporter substrate binding protein [Paracraurococcus sp. LOR1-02]MDO9707067.1 tripartite tricarboxylate transporter substrate binding protein [Paracraurococcus sp. LOR1-02]